MNDIVGTLLEQRLLDDGSARMIRQSAAEGKPLDDAFLEVTGVNGADGLTEEKLLRFFSQQFQIPYVLLEGITPPRELITRFPARLLLQHKLLPLEDLGDAIVVATSRVFDTSGLDELRLATGLELRPALARPAADIDQAAKRGSSPGRWCRLRCNRSGRKKNSRSSRMAMKTST